MGNQCFLEVRESFATVQAAMFVGEGISKGMVKYGQSLSPESIIDIKGKVSPPAESIKSCTQKIDLLIEELWCVNKSAPILPF